MVEDTETDVPSGPPSSERVAKRALVLAAVCCRGMLELDPDPGAGKFWDQVSAWWKSLPTDVKQECEREELELLDAPFRSAPEYSVVNATWRAESLVVLAWALGRSELPRHDEQGSPSEIARSVGFLESWPQARAAKLRPVRDLDAYREVALAVHWRLWEFSRNPRPIDFSTFAKTAFGPLSLEGVLLLEGDLAILGNPIGVADSSAVSLVTSIALERYLAANWLHDAWQLYDSSELYDASELLSETDAST